MTRVGWWVMTVFAIAIAAYGVVLLVFAPNAGPPWLSERFRAMPVATWAHILGGAVALAIGPFQLNSRLRSRDLGRHRWMGRVYLVAIGIGGTGGLMLATISGGGLTAHVGFGLLAVLWMATAGAAYVEIRRGHETAHRQWMIRCYALALAAVTLRIWMPLGAASGIPFEEAYPVVAWLCWVPNLLVAEWWTLRR